MKLPLRLKWAFMRELFVVRLVAFISYGRECKDMAIYRGLIQGSPGASFVFSYIINQILLDLDAGWRLKGCGIHFGAWGGNSCAKGLWFDEFGHLIANQDLESVWVAVVAFMDDIHLVAETFMQMQSMLNDLVLKLASIGLHLNPMKVRWISNKWAGHVAGTCLQLEGCMIPCSDTITVLGSVISGNLSEIEAFNHRISCAWACYNRWSRVLESQASFETRVKFWTKTVQHSLLWGLQTTRVQDKSGCLAKLRHAQRLMFRRMLRTKRRVEHDIYEPWLEWHIRSFRRAGSAIEDLDVEICDKLEGLKRSWAGHMVRFGLPKGGQQTEPRVLKALLFWRPLAWWRQQQWFNDLNWEPIRHPASVGCPKRWEEQFSTDWALVLG
jgi:hypothetical protein